MPLCSILGTADLVPHSLFAICGLVDEDAETMMGSVFVHDLIFFLACFIMVGSLLVFRQVLTYDDAGLTVGSV